MVVVVVTVVVKVIELLAGNGGDGSGGWWIGPAMPANVAGEEGLGRLSIKAGAASSSAPADYRQMQFCNSSSSSNSPSKTSAAGAVFKASA